MVIKSLKNKKRLNIFLKIAIIFLSVLLVVTTVSKIYFNKISKKEDFLTLKQENVFCNLDLIKTPYGIYNNYYITTTDYKNYVIIKMSENEYNKLLKFNFSKEKYNIKGISKKIDEKTLNEIKNSINDGKSNFEKNILYLDAYTISITSKLVIISIILLLISIYLLVINTLFLKSISIDKNALKKQDKEEYKRFGKLYISKNYIFKKDTFDLINIKDIILMYEKNNKITLVTKVNEIYKFDSDKNYDLFDIILSKNNNIIIGINKDIIKQIKKEYNITIEEVF